MITYDWSPELTGDDLSEVLDLVAAAAEFDAEAGFSSIPAHDVRAVGEDPIRIRHLPIRARRDLSPLDDVPTVVVAYLRLAVDADGLGTVDYVVHPDYRSRGVTTLLAEELGLATDGTDGWAGTGATALRCWAYATHPAAERFTDRFGVPAVRRQWTEARHLTGPFAAPLEPVAVPAGITLAEPQPVGDARPAIDAVLAATSISAPYRDRLSADLEHGDGLVIVAHDSDGEPAGFIWYSTDLHRHDELRAATIRALILTDASRGRGLGSVLVTRVLEEHREAGAQVSLMRIDPDDEGAVRMCRLLEFEQAESHSCYQVGQSAVPIPAFG